MAGQKPTQAKKRGFTLTEMAVALAVGGLVVGFWASSQGTIRQQTALDVTRERMETIRLALAQHVIQHGDMPCPAPLRIRVDANCGGGAAACFGREFLTVPANPLAVPPQDGHCNTNGTGPQNRQTPRALTGRNPIGSVPAVVADGFTNRRVRFGAVPVRTLGLPDEYAVDGWGTRFLYAVSANLTNALQGYERNNSDFFARGSIFVRDVDGVTNKLGGPDGSALFALVSAGPDKKGLPALDITATPANAIPAMRRCNIRPARDVENCDATTNLAGNVPNALFLHTSDRSLGDNAQYFDDIVTYATTFPEVINALYSEAEPPPCPDAQFVVGDTGSGSEVTITILSRPHGTTFRIGRWPSSTNNNTQYGCQNGVPYVKEQASDSSPCEVCGSEGTSAIVDGEVF